MCGQNHVICAECMKQGQVTATYAVDHITPHRGDLELFRDHSNHQGLCQRHHNAKAAREKS